MNRTHARYLNHNRAPQPSRDEVERTIREVGIERAWMVLGIGRTTIYEWRRRWRKEDERSRIQAAQAHTAEAHTEEGES